MQVIEDMDFTGRTVDHYGIIALIRGGGQGRVYRGRDEVLHRDVAIKVLNPDGGVDARARDSLLAEARVLSKVNHPNVAGIYDFITHDRRDFMVMEFIAGATLQEVLAGGPLPAGEVTRLGAQLARGLAAAHSASIAHGDIKPANLKITSSGMLKIVDFGVAVALPTEALVDDDRTTAPAVIGTLPYIAPEVLHGAPPDERSDIFSAGAVLYEMATGCRAFPQTTLTGLVHAIEASAVVTPSRLNPAISVAMDAVIMRALAKAPSCRHTTAIALAQALQQLHGQRGRQRKRAAKAPVVVRASTASVPAVTSIPARPGLPR